MKPPLEHINLLSEQLDLLYRSMKSERRSIAQWEETQEVSILGLLELFSGNIQGYAEQIITNIESNNLESIILNLRKTNLFEIDYFTVWYFANLDEYPQVKQYIEKLDHLRLLIIEHCITQVPVAA